MILADAGLPMLFVHLPSMLLALIPIVLIEALVYRSYVGKSFDDAWKGSWVANLVSMFVGIPISWVVLVIVDLGVGGGGAHGLETPMQRLVAVTVQAPWPIPYENDLYWIVPAATLTLLVPFLLVSIAVEFPVLRRRWGSSSDQLRLLNAVWRANLLSYSLLAALCLVPLIIARSRHWVIGLAIGWWIVVAALIGALITGFYWVMRYRVCGVPSKAINKVIDAHHEHEVVKAEAPTQAANSSATMNPIIHRHPPP